MVLSYRNNLNACALKVAIVTPILSISIAASLYGQTGVPLYSGDIPNSKKTAADYTKYINKWERPKRYLCRLPNDNTMVDKSIGPLQDAQTALMLIRKNAKQWNIDTARIGVIGFSAGGHLASTLGTHFDKPVIQVPDNISLRPDFSTI